METVIGLMLAASPMILTVALLMGADRRQQRVQAEVGRQIALTDALHARLGALVAPVVRRRGRLWQVSVAVPVEDPAIVGAVLATVDEVFGRAAYELRLRQQVPPAPAAPARRAARTVEGLSWT
ncbi:MAG TPA: hypothetical protein VMQ51_03695 [Candidatus Binatia bacterium]|nr:hypothetical protein [Candidatus Binatia bacterium]